MSRLQEGKRKDIKQIVDIIEQYDFFYTDFIMNALLEDQQHNKDRTMRSVIDINLDLKGIIEAETNFEEFENQLQKTYVDFDRDDIKASRIEIDLHLYNNISGHGKLAAKQLKKATDAGTNKAP